MDVFIAQQSVTEFVARQNVGHFRAKLLAESDPRTRERLHALLLEAVKDLRSSHEQLSVVEHQIYELTEQIAQAPVVADAGGGTSASAFLANLYRTVGLYEAYRAILVTQRGRLRLPGL